MVEKDPEARRARQRAWYAAHREEVLEKRRVARAANPEKYREYARKNGWKWARDRRIREVTFAAMRIIEIHMARQEQSLKEGGQKPGAPENVTGA